jgi:hypothetical protein
MPSIKSKTFLKIFLLGIITVLLALFQRVNFEIYSIKPNFIFSFLSSLAVSSLSIYQIWGLAFLAAIAGINGANQGIFAASILISFISMSWLAFRYLKRDWTIVIFIVFFTTILFSTLSFFLFILKGQRVEPLMFVSILPKEIFYNTLLSLALSFLMRKI